MQLRENGWFGVVFDDLMTGISLTIRVVNIIHRSIAHSGGIPIMTTMNTRLIPILLIAIILTGSIRPFSQNVLNPPSATIAEDSEAQATVESTESRSKLEETKKESQDSTDEDTNSSEDKSDSSRPLTQGDTLSAAVVEVPGRTLRLFPVSRMIISSINRPVIVWSLAHSMDMRLSRVVAVERSETFSLSVVAPPVQSHAPPMSV